MNEYIGDYHSFIVRTSAGLKAAGIARTELAMMDHLCYCVETPYRYTAMFEKLRSIMTLVGITEVSGRSIATFEFHDYLVADDWVVPYLELPQPKHGSFYAEGLEHAELVVIGDLAAFARRHRSLPFTSQGMSKLINPELGLKTDQLSVKFHEQPLGAVVRIEQRLAAKNV